MYVPIDQPVPPLGRPAMDLPPWQPLTPWRGDFLAQLRAVSLSSPSTVASALAALMKLGINPGASGLFTFQHVQPVVQVGDWQPNAVDVVSRDISALANLTIVDVVPVNQWWEVWGLYCSTAGSSKWWVLPAAGGPWVIDAHDAPSAAAIPLEDADATGVHRPLLYTPLKLSPGDAFGMTNTNNGGDAAVVTRVGYRRTG